MKYSLAILGLVFLISVNACKRGATPEASNLAFERLTQDLFDTIKKEQAYLAFKADSSNQVMARTFTLAESNKEFSNYQEQLSPYLSNLSEENQATYQQLESIYSSESCLRSVKATGLNSIIAQASIPLASKKKFLLAYASDLQKKYQVVKIKDTVIANLSICSDCLDQQLRFILEQEASFSKEEQESIKPLITSLKMASAQFNSSLLNQRDPQATRIKKEPMPSSIDSLFFDLAIKEFEMDSLEARSFAF